MSDIMRWEIRELENLRVSRKLTHLTRYADGWDNWGWHEGASRVDWKFVVKRGNEGRVAIISDPEEREVGIFRGWFRLVGTETEEGILVEEIYLNGLGSGYLFDDFVSPFVFQSSRGYMKALLVWDKGYYIEYLTVKDGVVEREEL